MGLNSQEIWVEQSEQMKARESDSRKSQKTSGQGQQQTIWVFYTIIMTLNEICGFGHCFYFKRIILAVMLERAYEGERWK